MNADSLLTVEGVSMHFGGLRALDAVKLVVRPRQVVGLIGPNGSGKSTLINVLSRIYNPTQGRAVFLGKDIGSVPQHGITGLGIARTFQNVRLFDTMTVQDNLFVGATATTRVGLWSSGLALPAARREANDVKNKTEEVATLLGLSDHLERVSGDLSYGLQKLVELGRALMSDPMLILLDEPVAGMNYAEKGKLLEAFQRVQQTRDVSFLLVEHDMNFVMALTQYIYVLNFGKVIAQGTPEEVKASPEVIEAYLGGASHVAD